MYTNDEMSKEHLLSAVFATSSTKELELLLIKEGVNKNMTRDFIEFIKEKNNDTSYLNDLVTVHPIDEMIDEAYFDGYDMEMDDNELIDYDCEDEIDIFKKIEQSWIKGWKEGWIEGWEKSWEKGWIEGLIQGQEQDTLQKRKSLINKLIEKGFSDKDIKDLLNISSREFTKLKEEL